MKESDIRLLMEISPDREIRPGWQRGVKIQRTRARLEEQISQLKAQVPRWISAKERLPGNCECVLCIVRYGEDVWNYDLGFVLSNKWVCAGRSDGIVTHWMPLPQPPEMKEETP